MAFLFLVCVFVAVGCGVLLGKKWQIDFNDEWPVSIGIGILGFLISGALMGLAFSLFTVFFILL